MMQNSSGENRPGEVTGFARSADGHHCVSSGNDGSQHIDSATVRDFAKRHATRKDCLPSHYFADAAWDLLLHLYADYLDTLRTPIGKLSAKSDIPVTTTLRWIKLFARDGLVVRTPHPTDRRLAFISLSLKGAIQMTLFDA